MKNLKKVISFCKHSKNYVTIYYNLINNTFYCHEFTDTNGYITLTLDYINLGIFSKNYPICHIPTMQELKDLVNIKLKEWRDEAIF